MAAQVARLPSAPHTPSNEWSQDAVMSLKKTSNSISDPTRSRSGPNTPSRELPGGFGSNTTNNVASSVGNTFETVGQTAFNLTPDKLKNAMSSKPAESTSTGPVGGVGDLPGAPGETHVAMPPLERRAVNKEKEIVRVHGIGELPGNDSETGVAKLPEERAQEPSSTTSQPLSATATNFINSTTQAVTNTATTVMEQIRGTVAGYTGSSVPSKTKIALESHPGAGVGSLPGTPGETGVAKLPLEREIEAHKSDTPVRGVGDLPGHPQETGVAILPLEKEVKHTLPHGPPVDGVGELPGSQSETSVAKLPAERDLEHSSKPTMEKAREKVAQPAEKVAEKVKPSQSSSDQEGHVRRASTSSSDGADGADDHKVGLAAKVKGEMKVLAGKITRNEAKVEHGKAIKSGELPSKNAL